MHRTIPLSSLTFLLGTFCAPISAADWPTYRHDNNRSGATTEKLTLPLQERWVYTSPAKPRLSWSGPEGRTMEGHKLRHRVDYDDALHTVVVGKRLFFGSSVDHQVRCMNLATGALEWTFFTGGAVRLAPTIYEGRVLFGSDDGFVYCLDAESGKLNWKLRGGPADERFLGRGEMISRWPVRTGVSVHDGVAYFGAGLFPHEDIFLYAVDAKSGKLIWKKDDLSANDAGRNSLTPQGYFLLNDAYLFLPSGREMPACFDRKTGKLNYHRRYSWRREGVVGSTRALLADGQIYSGGAHQLMALEQKTGKVGYAYIQGKQMVVAGNAGYTADGTAVSRLDRVTAAKATRAAPSLRNTLRTLMRRLRNPGKEADKIKADIAKIVEQMGAIGKKGLVWSTPLKSAGGLTASGGHVFAGGEGRVDALDAESGKIAWTAKVDGEARGIAAANGHLIVSTSTGKIYVFADAAQPKAAAIPQPKFVDNPYPKDKLTTLYSSAAEDILKRAKTKRGFCLVVGAEQGRLAYELAKRTELKFYGVESDATKVAQTRRLLSKAGLYGHRIVIHHADPADIPYSNYFANLVVSDSLLTTGKIPGIPKEIIRHVRPLGGAVVLGQPGAAGNVRVSPKTLQSWLTDLALAQIGKIHLQDNWGMFTRGKLRGAGNWTHQYGEPGNTAASTDTLVKGGLGVLWYGDPGPGKMVNRHEGAVGPLSVDGRLIVQGQFSVMAYDAYNGMFLWKHDNPKTFRTGVFQNFNASNLIADGGNVFVMEGAKVVQLDLDTGKLVKTHQLPPEKRKYYQWTYLAYKDGQLFGTATIRKELKSFLRRRGRKYEDMTDSIFAINVKTGEYSWTYKGKNIAAPTIALGPDAVYFIDSTISSEERADILRRESEKAKKLKGTAAKRAEQRLKKIDVRKVVALDAKSGKQLWAEAVEVTDISDIGAGGGKLTLMYKDDVLVVCGANANGHYWTQFVKGEFKRRRLVSLSAKNGKLLWAKDANYRHRPIIVGAKIIAEPWAFDLYSGKQIMRRHPLTGKEVPWSIYRPGHHCGMLTGSPNMLMFRSGFTGFYDLYSDGGTRHFAGHRLGCWINAIPAQGLVMIPEASAGCVCQFSIASTITMEPRPARRPWTIYSSVGPITPVENMALNLGAPGDRKDGRGQLWLAYPRPNPLRDSTLNLKLKLNEKFTKGGGFKYINDQLHKVESSNAPPWIFTSWASRLKRISLPLRGKADGPAKYTVRLSFADLDKKSAAGKRVFDVKLNGKTYLKGFDIAKARKELQQGLVREISGVRVAQNLVIELVPRTEQPTMRQLPILNAVEVVREK